MSDITQDIRIKFTEQTKYGELTDAIYYDGEVSQDIIASDIQKRVKEYEDRKAVESSYTLTLDSILQNIDMLERQLEELRELKESLEE